MKSRDNIWFLQVRLTLESVVDGNSLSDASLRKAKASPPVSQLVRLLWGEDTAELQMSIGHVPHVAMYLSLKLDSVSSKEEVSLYLLAPSGCFHYVTCLFFLAINSIRGGVWLKDQHVLVVFVFQSACLFSCLCSEVSMVYILVEILTESLNLCL